MRILNPNARRSAYDASLKTILNLQAGHEGSAAEDYAELRRRGA